MIMLIHERNCHSIHMRKSIVFNGSAIGTLYIVSSGVTTKIILLHFDFILLPVEYCLDLQSFPHCEQYSC